MQVERVERPKGIGPDSGGQSGDTQGLLESEQTTLLEEGQYKEAELVEALENAPTADEGTLHPQQAPEEGLPFEYLDEENPDGV